MNSPISGTLIQQRFIYIRLLQKYSFNDIRYGIVIYGWYIIMRIKLL